VARQTLKLLSAIVVSIFLSNHCAAQESVNDKMRYVLTGTTEKPSPKVTADDGSRYVTPDQLSVRENTSFILKGGVYGNQNPDAVPVAKKNGFLDPSVPVPASYGGIKGFVAPEPQVGYQYQPQPYTYGHQQQVAPNNLGNNTLTGGNRPAGYDQMSKDEKRRAEEEMRKTSNAHQKRQATPKHEHISFNPIYDYGTEMIGDAFGPSMSTKIYGSGQLRYNAVGTHVSGGGANLFDFDVTDSRGNRVGRSTSAGSGQSYFWRTEISPFGMDANKYPGGPLEWYMINGDPSSAAMLLPPNGLPLSNYANQTAPGNVTLNTYDSVVTSSTLNTADAVFAYDVEIPDTIVQRHLLGRVKISENMNVLPQTRIILDYNCFVNAPIVNRGANVIRFTPGLEWAFWRNRGSIEMRVPIGLTANTYQKIGSGFGNDDLDVGTIGDVTVTLKYLLWRSRWAALSAGMSVSAPTAKDRAVCDSDTYSLPFLTVKNSAWHIMPFVGLQYTPDNAVFANLFVQIDANTGGDSVSIRDFVNTGAMSHVGHWDEQTYVYISGSIGRWLYRDFSKARGLNGFNVSAEAHLTQSLGEASNINANFIAPNGSTEQITIDRRKHDEYLNITFGAKFLFNQKNSLGFAGCLPFLLEKQFDAEWRITYSRYF
jgi:hypothetical protein